jgi:branched-chain amino acid aminotransferase
MSGRIVFLNGDYLPAEQARVSVFDHGFLYGDGCFETIIIRRGRPFRLDAHIDRLFRTTHVLGMTVPVSRADLAAALLETVKRNGFSDAYSRITVSRGEGYSSSDPRLCKTPTLVIFAYDLESHPAEIFGGKGPGLRCVIVSTRRIPPICLDARVKATNYLNMILARMEAIAAGMDEAIMLDIENFVAECPSRNVFAIHQNVLSTPPDHNVLNGVTRDVVVELAEKNGWVPVKRPLTAYDLYTADEVLVCSTGGGIKPVIEIDGRKIGSGTVGPCTRKLMDQYEELLVS